MTKVLVLGATGMLGAMVLDWLRRDAKLEVEATCRDPVSANELRALYPTVAVRMFDAETEAALALDSIEWVINAIGVIKPYIRDDNRTDVERAIRVNALFPVRLAEEAERCGSCVLQIATDCVYSGRDGLYVESSLHDGTDVYGKSKSLGEVNSPNVTHLRCSIVGPEVKGHRSLLSWFLRQTPGSTVNGYQNHEWNGVTTLHFAKACHGIIRTGRALPGVQHVLPENDIAKVDLLRCFATAFGRRDVVIVRSDAPVVVDRRLRSSNPSANEAIWAAAGYDTAPTIEAMVAELAKYPFRG